MNGFELNVVCNSNNWWIDSDSNIHVCTKRSLFSNYQESHISTESMGNGSLAMVLREGQINLKLTSSKTLTLEGVQHVPNIRKNLISTSLLVQHGFKLVFESNKVVITKNEKFIGKGYQLFILNIVNSPLVKY